MYGTFELAPGREPGNEVPLSLAVTSLVFALYPVDCLSLLCLASSAPLTLSLLCPVGHTCSGHSQRKCV